MRAQCTRPRLGVVAAAALVLSSGLGGAQAGWLSRLSSFGDDAGKAGIAAGKAGFGALEGAAGYIAKLPPGGKSAAALAAHATPEGHWKLVNREGEAFTASGADEFSRALTTLAPDLEAGGKLAIYLSEETVFRQRGLIKDLPQTAELHIVTGKTGFRISRPTADGKFMAEIRDNLALEIGEQPLFQEAVFQLGRSLNTSNIRTLALETGGPRQLGSAPRFDPVKKTPLVDVIDPAALPGALAKVRGQTVLVTGRVENGTLYYRAGTGPEQSLAIADVRNAAEAADVNLVVLHAPAAHQPGGRNWLWQTVEVSGLDDALGRVTFADFLNALGAGHGRLTATAVEDGAGRILIHAVPSSESPIPMPGTVTDWLAELMAHTTGNVAVHAVTAYTRDKERQEELDGRIIPGIPSTLQYFYLGSILFALFGWEVSTRAWRAVWPAEARAEYASAFGYHAARAARGAAFILLFAPLAGVPSLLITLVLQLWYILTSPLRFLRWIARKVARRSADASDVPPATAPQ